MIRGDNYGGGGANLLCSFFGVGLEGGWQYDERVQSERRRILALYHTNLADAGDRRVERLFCGELNCFCINGGVGCGDRGGGGKWKASYGHGTAVFVVVRRPFGAGVDQEQ